MEQIGILCGCKGILAFTSAICSTRARCFCIKPLGISILFGSCIDLICFANKFYWESSLLLLHFFSVYWCFYLSLIWLNLLEYLLLDMDFTQIGIFCNASSNGLQRFSFSNSLFTFLDEYKFIRFLVVYVCHGSLLVMMLMCIISVCCF